MSKLECRSCRHKRFYTARWKEFHYCDIPVQAGHGTQADNSIFTEPGWKPDWCPLLKATNKNKKSNI